MIEAILLKMGFSGIVASLSLAALLGLTIYHKNYRTRQEAIIAAKTAQVRSVAAERDNLLNANRAYSQTVASQNKSIENLMELGKIQRGKAEDAKREMERVKESWEKFIEHLDQSSPQAGDRWALYGDTYSGIARKWNKDEIGGK